MIGGAVVVDTWGEYTPIAAMAKDKSLLFSWQSMNATISILTLYHVV